MRRETRGSPGTRRQHGECSSTAFTTNHDGAASVSRRCYPAPNRGWHRAEIAILVLLTGPFQTYLVFNSTSIRRCAVRGVAFLQCIKCFEVFTPNQRVFFLHSTLVQIIAGLFTDYEQLMKKNARGGGVGWDKALEKAQSYLGRGRAPERVLM